MASNIPEFEEFNSKTSKKRSDVWINFGFLKVNDEVNKSKVVCKLCRAILPYSGNTTNLHAHVDRNHWSTKDYKTVPRAARSIDKSKVSEQPTVSSMFGKQQPLARDSQRSVMINKAIANFLVIDMKPFGTVEGAGFKHIMSVIEPRYTVTPRNHMVEKYMVPLYQNTMVDVKEEISKAARHAFTTDAWTSLSMDSFITTTCHYIEPDTFELKAKVLDTKCVKVSHTAENLSNEMKFVSNKWGFKDPVAVTDNAANIVSACRVANYPHLGCFGHTLNLAVNRCMTVSEVSALMGKFRKLVAVFKQSYMKTIALHSAQAALELKELQVIQDVETRWNSALAMVRRLLDIFPAVWAVLYKDNKYSHLLPSDSERMNMEALQNVLTPIEEATVRVSSEKLTTASMIIPILQRLLAHDLILKEADTPLVRKAKESIRKDLSKRYQNDDEKSMLEIATALDPRLKRLQWMDCEERNNVFARLKAEMMRVELPQNVVKKEKEEPEKIQSEATRVEHDSQNGPDMPQLEPELPALPDMPVVAGTPPSLSMIPGTSDILEIGVQFPDRKKIKQENSEKNL